jgi:hypothetical protein
MLVQVRLSISILKSSNIELYCDVLKVRASYRLLRSNPFYMKVPR